MNYELMLKEYLSTCSGKVLSVLYEVYQIIKKVEEDLQPEAVEYFLTVVGEIESDGTNKVTKKYFTDVQLTKVRNKFESKNFEKAIQDEVTNDSQGDIEPIEFYRRIWEKIRAFCKNDREYTYALFMLLDSNLIPYRKVGVGISMSEEEYAAGLQKLRDTVLEDTRYILKLRYHQKTQYASLLVDRLKLLEDSNLQAIYMATIVNIVEENIKKKIYNSIKEL